MNKDDKIKVILDDIANNYEEFQKQAKEKLKKQTSILNPNDNYRELISDVMFSIVDNLKTVKEINKYYNMCKQNKLRLYIFKAIDINTKHATSPFLRKKLKEYNRCELVENYYFEEIFNDDGFLFYYIMAMLEYPYAKKVLGEDWKYYSELFKEYINDIDSSYASIEKKYGLPSSTLHREINYVKDKIKAELKKLGLNKNNLINIEKQ